MSIWRLAAKRLAAKRRGLLPMALVCAAAGWPAGAALASSPPPLTVVLSPCSAPSATAGCRLDPAQLQVDVPSDGSVPAVQVSWVPGVGRPASAPSPASSQVVLAVTSPAACQNQVAAPSGFSAVCWHWPAPLTFASGGTAWILNGTYRVTPCSATSSSGSSCASYSTTFNSALAEVAVPPAAPAQVSATQANGAVTLTWRPGPEPDLVGYTVARNNQLLYTCSTDGAGPGAGTACANPPSLHDQPGSGTWNYSVTALRFGIDASASHVVSSAPSLSSVAVPVPPANATGGGAGGYTYAPGTSASGRAALPPLPSVGIMKPVGQMTASGGVAGAGVPSLADMEDSGGAPGSAAGLPYSDNPALGGSLASGSLVSAQKPGDNLDATAELALGVIALALAVHVWYLRGQLRVAAVRVAARRAAEGAAT